MEMLDPKMVPVQSYENAYTHSCCVCQNILYLHPGYVIDCSGPVHRLIHDVGECLMAFLSSSKVKPVHLVFVVFCQVVQRQTSSGGLWGIMLLTQTPNLSLGMLRE